MRFNSFPSPSLLFLSLPLYLFILPTSTISSSIIIPRFDPYFADIVKRAEGRNFSAIYNLPHNIALDTDVARNSLGAGGGDLHEAHHELYRVVTEATPIHLALTLIPAFIVFFGLFSAFVKEKLYVGEAIIAVVFGIILGPMVTGLFDPRSWGGGKEFDHLTLELTRVVISLSVFAVGVELPKAYVLRHWRSLAVLLGPLMLIGWMISGLLIYLLIPGLDFLSSLLVAAACTPTDPILAASVVGKGKYAQKHVPAHLRHLLQAESGCNDGAAFPFLFLALFIALRGDYSLGKVVGEWILLVILYQIVLGTAIGAVIGIIARKTLKFCKRRSYIDRESMVAMYVALALLTTGLTTLVGSDDLLAAFACGTAFAWDDWFTESIEASNFSSIIDLLINCATFIYVGATIPFKEWNDPTLTLVPWRIVILAFSIICLRRLPAMLLLQKLIPDIKTGREAVFSGHFGPIGVGAIFISTLAVTKLPTPNIPPQNSLDTLALTAQPLTYLFVLFSVLIHGLSIPFFTLGRNVTSRVHSISRTWTQASGNEPSWLNRVKRVDRNADGDIVDANGERVPMPGETPPTPLNNAMDLEKQIGIPQANLGQPLNPSSPTTNPLERPTYSTRPSYHSEPPPPEPIQGPSLAHTLQSSPHGLGNLANRSLARTSSLFKATRRTEQEEQARKLEKLRRDDWCRKERRDVAKKGEEMIYRSGRHIIIERGDGDEVEVRDADPSTAAVERAEKDPNLGLLFIPAGRLKAEMNAVERDGVSGPSRRLEAFKRIVKGGLGKQHKGGDSVLPGPGQGPRSAQKDDLPQVSNVSEDPRAMLQPGDTINPSSSHTHTAEVPDDQQSWIEGHKIVVENNNGEDVHVLSIPQNCSDSPAFRSEGPLVSMANDTVLTDENPPPDNNDAFHNQQQEHLANSPRPGSSSSRPSSPSPEDPLPDDDEWEEDDDSQSVHSSTQRSREGSSHARSNSSARPRSSRHSLRRPQIVHSKAGHSGAKSASVDDTSAARRAPHHPSRTIGFHNVKDHHPRSGLSAIRSGHASTRSSSPSQSIRFADHMARPNRGGSKKPKKRSRLGLLKRMSSSHPGGSQTKAESSDNAEDPLVQGDKEAKTEN